MPRRRDPQIDTAVLDATLALLAEAGYGRLTVEEVARRSAASKPAIYRRWENRQRLVLAALGPLVADLAAPDTGCTLCDLDECLGLFVAAYERMPPDVLGPLYADCAADDELRGAFMGTLFAPPREAVKTTLDRAYARGDLREDVDRELTLDLLASLVHYRALFGHRATTEAEMERAVTALLRGIAADYPRLLAHSRATSGDSHMHRLHT